MSSPFDYQVVTQTVAAPSNTPWYQAVDLSIPSGYSVVGSGAIVTQVEDGGILTNLDSVDENTVANEIDTLRVLSGPHPTDPTLWRVTLSQVNAMEDNNQLTVEAWIAAIGPGS